jgi:CHAD domain-containing protein
MAPARKVRGLICDDSFSSAAGKIVWTRFDEMMSFTDIALEGKDIEGVHDMRVASRRLRAALEVFRSAFPKRQLKPMLRDVKRLADALGEVRDLDVMLDRLKADMAGRPYSQRLVLKEMMEEMQAQREKARDALKDTIDELERSDFPRRFLVFVARATT